jgi:hypothetical protein
MADRKSYGVWGDVWILEVHFYPHATRAGVEPVEVTRFTDEQNSAFYRSHAFHFDRPPSREDFIGLCAKYLPWTHGWELLEVLKNPDSPWPMVTSTQKADDSNIVDHDGLQVGRLYVRRHTVYAADGYDRAGIAIPHEVTTRVLNLVPKDRRIDASYLILQNGNRIQEKISKVAPNKRMVEMELRELLSAHGFIGKGSRKRSTK